MTQDAALGFRFRKPTPVVGATLILLVALWVSVAIAFRFVPGGEALYKALILDPKLVLRGQHLWTLITAALLHSLGDTDHLVFNALGFYFFAPDLEELWGRGRFVLFMILCALGGHAFVLASALLGLGAAPVVGFSGVVFGVVAAFALTYPDREIWFFFFRLRALHLLYISIGIQLLTALSLASVSAAAHFGGMTAGAAFAATRSGPLRRWWLQKKLARLQSEAEELRGEKPARRRVGGPDLRVIQGGADRPKDKRYLN